MTKTTTNNTQGVVAELRALMPKRALDFTDSLHLAELQANRFLKHFACDSPPFSDELIAALPRVELRRVLNLGHDGQTAWERGRWQVRINAADSPTRQRFTACHELKHILDASVEDVIYGHLPEGSTRTDQIEAICNYFAACLLMPKRWVKRAWANGRQDVASLAWYFEVSPQAMQIRLQTLGLMEPLPRCATLQRLGAPVVRAVQQHRVRRTYYRPARFHASPSIEFAIARRPA